MGEPADRVTYTTLDAGNEALHAEFETGLAEARGALGGSHRFRISGEQRPGVGVHLARSPIDREVVIGEFAQATPSDVDDAVESASSYLPSWAATPWEERVALLRGAAGLITQRRGYFAATISLEVGKNRMEALAEVEEVADTFRYYAEEMERYQGFRRPMQPVDDAETVDVMHPRGVWAVISPFNFPWALAAGPVGAALVTGNTVVLKPATAAALSGLLLADTLAEAGLPTSALHVLTGSGHLIGEALATHPRVAGVTFTGSAEVGMEIFRSARDGRPIVCELGGKNPVIVATGADLDAAAEATLRSAFGFGGQKCSAASRVFVIRRLYDAFLQRLVTRTTALEVGDPLERRVFLGPLIDEAAVTRYLTAVAEATAQGMVITGGKRLTSGALARGGYVLPTVVEVPDTSPAWQREMFVPLLAAAPVDSLDEALARANHTSYGLTAGFYGSDPTDISRFLEEIQAGVLYVNHRGAATTGAWPGAQPFVGWKGSGTTGKGTGGPYYLAQYLREQSRTISKG
jgi:1-pyrroline-5-carboxylate dehydrogenase